MKPLKRTIAAIIAVVMMIGIFTVSSFAAQEPPIFTLNVKSQNSSTVVLEFALKSGSFNSLDVKFDVSGVIGSCQKITVANDFKKLKEELEDNGGVIIQATSATTQSVSLASTASISKPGAIYELTYAKKSSGNAGVSNYKATVTSCVATVADKNVDYTNSAKVLTGFIEFKNDTMTANYKSTKKIEFSSNYSANQIKWESSNTKVATVDGDGNVKMVGKGNAVITAKSTDGIAKAECKVTVTYSTIQWIIVIVLFGWIWY